MSRKKIISLIGFIFILFSAFSVDALIADPVSISIKNKSDTIEVENPTILNNEISSSILFNKINDYVTFTITLKNTSGVKYKIKNVVDNNTSGGITVAYDYPSDYINVNDNFIVDVTLTYTNLLNNSNEVSLDALNIDFTFEDENNEVVHNPVTSDQIMIYVIFFVVSLLAIIVFSITARKEIFGLTVCILIIPFLVSASQSDYFRIVFKTIKIDVLSYENVSAMVSDNSLHNGQIVATKGYYSKALGGSGKYTITDDNDDFNGDTDFTLSNGLYALLFIENNTVSVNQYGAYGDGIHDDTLAIRKAINSGNSVVIFEGGRYKCNRGIVLGTSNVTLEGNNSELFYDDDYVGNAFYFFSINSNISGGLDEEAEMLQNITIKNLKFKDLVTKIQTGENDFTCKVQMRVYNIDGLIMDGVELLIPEIVGNKTKYTMNLWIYSGWKNITIRNSRFVTEVKTPINCCGISIGSRNHEYESENLLFENNYVYKSGHDELIAIFNGVMRNIIIRNNEFYEDDSDVEIPSDMLFTIGYGYDDEIVENVQILNNTFVTNSRQSLFVIRANTTNPRNCVIKDNVITHTLLDQREELGGAQYTYLISTTVGEVDNKAVVFENNIVNLTIESPEIDFSFAKNRVIAQNNDITINGKISYFLYNTYRLELNNNRIVLNDGCDVFIKNVYNTEFDNNDVTINKVIGNNFISYSSKEFTGNVTISNNDFTIETDDIWTNNSKNFFVIYNSDMGVYTVDITNNTIDAVGQENTQILAKATGMITDSVDLIHFENNTASVFTKVNYWDNTGEVHILVE